MCRGHAPSGPAASIQEERTRVIGVATGEMNKLGWIPAFLRIPTSFVVTDGRRNLDSRTGPAPKIVGFECRGASGAELDAHV